MSKKIPKQSLDTLKGKNWLDDEVINNYLALLVKKNSKFGYANSFFYTALSQHNGFADVAQYKIAKDIKNSKFDDLLIPIHLTNHWILIHVHLVGKEKKIKVYDSFNVEHPIVANKILEFLKYLGLKAFKISFAKCPQQNNGYDCGVFILAFAECLVNGKPISSIKQAIIPEYRKKIHNALTKK